MEWIVVFVVKVGDWVVIIVFVSFVLVDFFEVGIVVLRFWLFFFFDEQVFYSIVIIIISIIIFFECFLCLIL